MQFKYHNRLFYISFRLKNPWKGPDHSVPSDDERCQAKTIKGHRCKKHILSWRSNSCNEFCDQHCIKLHGLGAHRLAKPPADPEPESENNGLPDTPAEWLASLVDRD